MVVSLCRGGLESQQRDVVEALVVEMGDHRHANLDRVRVDPDQGGGQARAFLQLDDGQDVAAAVALAGLGDRVV
jgi:hypothetical protein